MQPLLTTDDVAAWLNVDVVTVRRLVERGEFAAYRVGGEYRFELNDIREYLARVRVCTPRRSVNAPFDRYSDEARQTIARAQEEAQRLRHRFIGTEHVLLALVRDSDAARVLSALGVEAQTVASAVEAAVSPGQIEATSELGVTARAKKVFHLAVDEADQAHHNQVGTGQLLMALLREGDGVAAKVLRGLGVDLERLRHEVARVPGATPS